jgi:signal transduction histidine kinase
MKNRVEERRDCWPLSLCGLVCFTIFGILLCALMAFTAAAQDTEKNVLLLFSSVERNSSNWEPFDPLVRARVPGQITFYRAYLDEPKAKEKSYLESQAETFRQTYAGVKLDLVIAGTSEQLRFAVLYRDKIFPNVPIVFTGVSATELEGQKMWPGVTGVTVPVGLRETINLALRLHPDTNTVAVITNASGIAEYWLSVAHTELLRHQDKITEIDLVGPASGQLLERAAELPAHTVVLFQLAPDSSRPTFGALDLLTAVAQRLPTYSPWPSLCLNFGCVGGVYEDWPKERSLVAEMAARILLGERPEDIPVVNAPDLQVRVDSRALLRWHIPDSALPAGSQILYREPTLWERARKYAIAAVAVIIVQFLLIFGLLWQRARKRNAEAALRESEKRFGGRLLEAQEEERRRIARELHDDICQKLALLSTELVVANRSVNGSAEVTKQALEGIRQHCSHIAHDVQSLSHQLHNSKLEYVGIVSAIRGLCNEVRKQCDVRIEFRDENVPKQLPANISLCLFRVAQEALHNAVKYSGVRQFEVEIRAGANEVELVVIDAGAGFDVDEATTSPGLGLMSMQERVHLVRGRFGIESRPGSGTKIVAAVPLAGSDDGTSANAGGHPVTVQGGYNRSVRRLK